jgi:hypothetical protein
VIKSRKITNPDASKNDLCIQISVAGEKVWAVPILFSRSPRYDTARGGEFFQYLTLALLLVEKPRDGSIARPLSDSNGIRMARLDQVSGFFEQVGRNTQYIIHADEILADNFALLAQGDWNVSSPEVLTKIQNALTKYGAATTGASGPKMGPPRR